MTMVLRLVSMTMMVMATKMKTKMRRKVKMVVRTRMLKTDTFLDASHW